VRNLADHLGPTRGGFTCRRSMCRRVYYLLLDLYRNSKKPTKSLFLNGAWLLIDFFWLSLDFLTIIKVSAYSILLGSKLFSEKGFGGRFILYKIACYTVLRFQNMLLLF
jgi:hypothetical protein